MSIFSKYKAADLREFVAKWASVADIDSDLAFSLADDAVKFYKTPYSAGAVERKHHYLQDLEDEWYRSLERHAPDYSVYDAQYILSDIWACWVVFSRSHLMNARKHLLSDVGEVNCVVDLGCGFGYTTAALKELFPSADVFGTNVEGGSQWKLAETNGREYGFSMVSDVRKLNRKVDLIFASEYFEHWEEPIAHLADVLTTDPEYLWIQNSFGSKALGHFVNYKRSSDWISGDGINRAFNGVMRSVGYAKVETKCWNDHPVYWKKCHKQSFFT